MNKAILLPVLMALPAGAIAQQDRIYWTDGTVTDKAKVTKYDIRELTFSVRGASQTRPSDQVSKVEIAKFKDIYKRGIAGRDPGLFISSARDRIKAKDTLLAQFGFVEAANIYMDAGEASLAVSSLEEMKKSVPEAGLLPELYRTKMEIYLGRGKDGASNAKKVASTMVKDATTNAWPNGYTYEGQFFQILAEYSGGELDQKAYQSKLRALLGNVAGRSPNVANLANVQLAHSLRDAGDLQPLARSTKNSSRRRASTSTRGPVRSSAWATSSTPRVTPTTSSRTGQRCCSSSASTSKPTKPGTP